MWNGQDHRITQANKQIEKLKLDKEHLEKYFIPDLAWEQVMKKIKAKEDVDNVSNASPYFGKYLKTKRQQIVVIPHVLAILGKHFADQMITVNGSTPKRGSMLPHNPEPHQMSSLLNCRLVCKSWNKAVDDFFQNREHVQHYNWKSEFYHFTCEADFVRFQSYWEHYQDIKKNPILGRGVHMSFDADAVNVDEFTNGCLEFARRYGNEIWYLQISNFNSRWTRNVQLIEFHNRLIQMVSLMPNLKTLEAFCRRPMPYDVDTLEAAIEEDEFPTIDNLEVLDMNNLPEIMMQKILQHNRHLKELKYWRDGYHVDLANGLIQGYFPNLKVLSMNINYLSVFEEFENYHFPLNLKSFEIHFQANVTFVPWSRVFKAIESKLNPEICTQLVIQFPNPSSEAEKCSVLTSTLEYRLNFPNIKKFVIWNEMPFCLDFLLPSKNALSEIQVYQWADFGNQYQVFVDKQLIKFLGYKENIQNSDMHIELPRLKRLTVLGFGNHTFYEFDGNHSWIYKG